VSDEFHERFLEMANEDTSEDILKAPLESPLMADTDDGQFPADVKEEEPPKAGEKLALEFESTDMGSPAKTIFAGPDALDLLSPSRKAAAPKGLDLLAEKVAPKELVVEKVKQEVLSLQDELARLTTKPKKEAKIEAPAPVAPVGGDKFELTDKLEAKLSRTIKELLWEIVPPLAEKIIKDEIDKIKSDLNESGL